MSISGSRSVDPCRGAGGGRFRSSIRPGSGASAAGVVKAAAGAGPRVPAAGAALVAGTRGACSGASGWPVVEGPGALVRCCPGPSAGPCCRRPGGSEAPLLLRLPRGVGRGLRLAPASCRPRGWLPRAMTGARRPCWNASRMTAPKKTTWGRSAGSGAGVGSRSGASMSGVGPARLVKLAVHELSPQHCRIHRPRHP